MVQVSSCGAKISALRIEPRARFAGLLSSRQIGAAAAALMMFGGLGLANGAYAQSTSAASPDACVAKCTQDHEKCINDQSSPELCAYELKGCKVECEKKK
ncbi:hypothetical protein [Methylocapsa acidiphila]|uniref:hypothetical protein n=1 Tax=Methylocapsa acidiphila TaxID=133552 RepID=UPI00047C6755|nr:hypothetical protein [Methylocapsa acidiphila]